MAKEITFNKTKLRFEVRNGFVIITQFQKARDGGKGHWFNSGHILVPSELVPHLTPLALDGAIVPDNQQVFPADVLDGDGVLPEPPRQ